MTRHGYVLSSNEGTAYWFLGTRMTAKVDGEVSLGAFTLIDQECPRAFATPAHIHEVDDEAFYVLEGALRVTYGEEEWRVGAGGFVFLPRGVRHGFEVVGDSPARLLQITSPAGFEHFAAEAGEPAAAPGLPPPSPIDVDRLAVAATHHRYHILPSAHE